MFETSDLDFDDGIFESELLDKPLQIERPNKHETRKDPFVKPAARKTHKIVKRKFPGPAGLLPEMRDLNVDITKLSESVKENDPSGMNNEYLCSQSSVANFREATWSRASDDYKPAANLLGRYNIAWIKDRAKTRSLPNDKAPFLAASIKKIECVAKTPTFILEDPTGEIDAVISEELYEELTEYLTLNSVVVLKQFSVLAMSNSKKLYAIVTLKNLIKIYSYRKRFDENLSGAIDTERDVEILTVHDIPNEEIINDNNLNITDSNTTDLNLSDVDFSEDFDPIETATEKNRNRNTNSIFGTDDFDASFGEPSPRKRAKASKFAFNPRTNRREKTDDSTVVTPSTRIDRSQVTILSQNKENLDEVKNAFSGLDADTLFDDF